MNGRMALCPDCDAPLIATFAFSGYEFYCLECGRKVTFFGPKPAEPSAELDAQYAELKAEWDEHVGAKLVARGSRLTDCPLCRGGEDHSVHATQEEWAAHKATLAWLHERASRARLTDRVDTGT
jgi:hypothetical protein